MSQEGDWRIGSDFYRYRQHHPQGNNELYRAIWQYMRIFEAKDTIAFDNNIMLQQVYYFVTEISLELDFDVE